MPARSPRLSDQDAARLGLLGESIRRRRGFLGISAAATAGAAGMSRTTLHRIERGEPSVTMGAYLAALSALGVDLSVLPRDRGDGPGGGEEESIQLEDFPELRRLCWHLPGAVELTPRQALEVYERGWRHVDREALSEEEESLIQRLADRFGGGRLLV